jgi:hypothetical protein
VDQTSDAKDTPQHGSCKVVKETNSRSNIADQAIRPHDGQSPNVGHVDASAKRVYEQFPPSPRPHGESGDGHSRVQSSVSRRQMGVPSRFSQHWNDWQSSTDAATCPAG